MALLKIIGLFGFIGAVIGYIKPEKIGFKSKKEALHTGIFALAIFVLAVGYDMNSSESEPQPQEAQSEQTPG